MRNEESDPNNKSAKEHKHTLSQVTRWLMKSRLGEALIFGNVCWSECTSSCIEWELQKTWMLGVVVVGGIYSPQPPHNRWGWLLSMGAPDSPVCHRTLSGVPPHHPTVRVLEQLTVGGFVHLWHWTVWCRIEQVLFTVRCASDSTRTVLHCSSDHRAFTVDHCAK
jgi:hypothetical protein